jgi:hypothetical protein
MNRFDETRYRFTRPIGERFKVTVHHPYMPDTRITLEVVEDQTGTCRECWCRFQCLNRPDIKQVVGLCGARLRTDRKQVIFKKVD